MAEFECSADSSVSSRAQPFFRRNEVLSSCARRTAEGGSPHMVPSRTAPAWPIELYCVGLLFREIANHGKLIHLSLIGLDEHNDPQDQASKAYQEM